VAAVRDEAIWRYELSRDPGSDYCHDLQVVETRDGVAVGLVAHLKMLLSGALVASLVELRDGVTWHETTGSVLRGLRTAGSAIAEREGELFRSLAFDLTSDHPLFRLAASQLPGIDRPFAWDVRLPDVEGFVRHVAPVLEQRLAGSVLSGYTGDLRMSFYRSGLHLRFVQGRLDTVEPWLPDPVWRADLAFPGQAFLYLLFGSRSLGQLEVAFPDCRARSDLARVLVETLFPVAPSVIWPIA
jgi:hypothetical protein